MKTLPLLAVKNPSKLVAQVAMFQDEIIITRYVRPAAVIVSSGEYED